jgi:hypothetical protein
MKIEKKIKTLDINIFIWKKIDKNIKTLFWGYDLRSLEIDFTYKIKDSLNIVEAWNLNFENLIIFLKKSKFAQICAKKPAIFYR